MSSELTSLLLVTGASLLNILLTFYLSKQRVKPEIDKMQAERYESISAASESVATGAQISTALLLERITEIRQERDNWRSYALILRAQVESLNATPIPFDIDEIRKITQAKK